MLPIVIVGLLVWAIVASGWAVFWRADAKSVRDALTFADRNRHESFAKSNKCKAEIAGLLTIEQGKYSAAKAEIHAIRNEWQNDKHEIDRLRKRLRHVMEIAGGEEQVGERPAEGWGE